MNRHISSVRQHSSIVLRHLCYVGRHVSVQCNSTPASTTTLLLRGQACLYSVRRHSCIILRHLYCGQTCLCSVQYRTFRYLLCYVPLIHLLFNLLSFFHLSTTLLIYDHWVLILTIYKFNFNSFIIFGFYHFFCSLTI